MSKNISIKKITWIIAAAAGVSLVFGAVFQWGTMAGSFGPGFLSSSLLFFLSGLGLVFVWKKAGGGKALAWMMALSFILRVVLGVLLIWGLPRFGYDTPVQQSGFVFEDAHRRERNAWNLAQSGDSLITALDDELGTDQYGGMLALSALVYRTISSDAFRPGLITILAAAAMSLSIPFFVVSARKWFNSKAAIWAGWILALYPEGILLGASQMREPFYILFTCILFWAASNWLQRSRRKWVLPIFVMTALVFSLFSYRAAIPAVGVILLWVWVMQLRGLEKRWIRILGWGLVGLGILGIWFVFRDWLGEAMHWDILLTVRASGMVQFQLERLPQWLHLPFITVYGLFQPVLPAAIAVRAPWIWKFLSIFRSAGWYAIMPLLIYGAVRVWKERDQDKRALVLILLISVLVWTVISSARAGGDQWDNPRYRTIFIPWMALIAGWGINFASETRDRWLGRWLLVMGIFLFFFTEWYVSRYFPVIPRPEFWVVILLIVLFSSGVIIFGLWRDRKRKTNTSD